MEIVHFNNFTEVFFENPLFSDFCNFFSFFEENFFVLFETFFPFYVSELTRPTNVWVKMKGADEEN